MSCKITLNINTKIAHKL